MRISYNQKYPKDLNREGDLNIQISSKFFALKKTEWSVAKNIELIYF